MLPLKCDGTKPPLVRAVISSNKPFLVNKCSLAMSMFMQVLACSTIQYCGESFNGAEVMCRLIFRERIHFYKIPSYSWKAYPRTRRKGVLLQPVSE